LTIYFDGIGESRGWSTAVKERDQGEEERSPAAFNKVRDAPAPPMTLRRPGERWYKGRVARREAAGWGK
jgi:hypothetical protein